MGHILHDWDLDEKRVLLQKAYDALPDGGALIVYEAIIDDDRRENAFGLLMSLNMLIETPGGFDYTGADCRGWMAEDGLPRKLRRAPGRARLDGRRHQVSDEPASATPDRLTALNYSARESISLLHCSETPIKTTRSGPLGRRGL